MEVRLVLFALAASLLVIPAFARSGGHGGGHSSSHSSSRSSSGPTSSSKVHVKGYTKKDGTHIAPHDRTPANGTQTDNWSAKGNVNPETGKAGTKDVQK